MTNFIFSQIQNRISNANHLVIIVGTGSSICVDPKFGMDALENHLKDTIPRQINGDPAKQSEWEKMILKRKDVDFETSLNEISSPELLKLIIHETGSFLCEVSRKLIPAWQNNTLYIPISVLFNNLREHWMSLQKTTVDVVTPNYDLLIEYALGGSNSHFTDGFYGGIRKEFNWSEAESDFRRPCNIKIKAKSSPSGNWKTNNHFRLHKIHGSLNYFVCGDSIVRDDTLALLNIEGNERFLITPGYSKYERIVNKAREFYKESDYAIECADCFIFIGYGFNDKDIDEKIRRYLKKEGENAIIITKQILGKGKELTEAFPNIISIEEDTGGRGSLIHFQGKSSHFNENIWEIDTFVKTILC